MMIRYILNDGVNTGHMDTNRHRCRLTWGAMCGWILVDIRICNMGG